MFFVAVGATRAMGPDRASGLAVGIRGRRSYMLTVTDAALQHLRSALVRADAAAPVCFRLTARGSDSLGLIVQEPESDDQTYEYGGDTVLATPEPLREFLAQRVLDLDDDGQLVLVPKAA
jgi:hypothetical protein